MTGVVEVGAPPPPEDTWDLLPTLILDEEGSRGLVQDRMERVLSDRLLPPPDLTLSQWADEFRYLSPEASNEPGPWSTDRAPYLRGIQDACSDPKVERVCWMAASQVGKTEVVNNLVGYYVHQDPSPMLVVQPTLQAAAEWSKDRLAPMFRDSPALQKKLRPPRSRDSGNTILHKAFEGGRLSIVGANSPSGLSSKPIRIVLCDEVDRMSTSAGGQGDPISMAIQRTRTFWNRKIVLISTPTFKGASRIEREWLRSTQSRFWVPCPHCEAFQTLQWDNVRWETDEVQDGNVHRPETAAYLCEDCGSLIEEHHKMWMLRRGEWRSRHPERSVAGFHLSALYSPFAPWQDLVEEFLEKKDDPNEFITWVNFVLGEPWEEKDEDFDARDLEGRLEVYSSREDVYVPSGAGALVCSVDTQPDRLEVLVRGYGEGEESWQILFDRLHGDPELQEVWSRLDSILLQPYKHESGANLRIRVCMIDSGGHNTTDVYRFVKGKEGRGVFALKGVDSRAREPLKRSTRKNKYGVKLWTANMHDFRWKIYRRLRMKEPGPGFLHYRSGRWGPDAEFLAQLGAWMPERKKRAGQVVIDWKKVRERDEGFQLEGYNLVGLHVLGDAFRSNLGVLAERASIPPDQRPERKQKGSRRSRKKGFATSWK